MKQMHILTRLSTRLTTAVGAEERYGILPQAFHELVKGDALVLLRKDGGAPAVVSCRGLSPDAMGRSFRLPEHPQLDVICNSMEPVVFPSDCTLAAPCDGLIGALESKTERLCQVSRQQVQDARGLKGGEFIGTSKVIGRLRQGIDLIAR